MGSTGLGFGHPLSNRKESLPSTGSLLSSLTRAYYTHKTLCSFPGLLRTSPLRDLSRKNNFNGMNEGLLTVPPFCRPLLVLTPSLPRAPPLVSFFLFLFSQGELPSSRAPPVKGTGEKILQKPNADSSALASLSTRHRAHQEKLSLQARAACGEQGAQRLQASAASPLTPGTCCQACAKPESFYFAQECKGAGWGVFL